ncbi:hypothetical protein SARC_00706 [Sphaeroforma arctica JP610]|uniref:small monomeric GTPase n=1 Tax=Sphaeroforma arctica JP610 TaxID=667725 RepID=A0A0L0GFX1_9EUKA|nr:hypothetical protein SARC_00706 [Sphaeroforma arctica JP610]KNC87178.1 hypothetical protein SARC_00706 [Sphaeroforma arctica JP610]|eukprot:XP_014161080.1 hypothetical protein SARC_00706 [Sphaeroforma arctica JP610]
MATSFKHGRRYEGKRISIVVLGAPGVGKSTLVNRFVTGMYHEKTWSSVDEIREKTIYFDRREITLEIHDMQGVDNNMGEANRARVSTMANNADGVVLCYAVDSSHSLRVVFDIYKLIWGLRIPDHAPVVLAGLRSDGVLVGKKVVTRLDGMKTVDTLGISRDHFHEVCSRKNKNVTSTFYSLVRQILAVQNQTILEHKNTRASRAPSMDSVSDANSIVKRSISAPGVQRLAKRLSMAPGSQSDLTEMDFVAIPEMTASVSVNDIVNRWSVCQANNGAASTGALNAASATESLGKSKRKQSLSTYSFSLSSKEKDSPVNGRNNRAEERKKTAGNTFGRRISTTSLRHQHQDHLQRRSSAALLRTSSSQTSTGLTRNGFKLGGDSSCSTSLSTNDGSNGSSGVCSPLSSGTTSPDQGTPSDASPRSRNGSLNESPADVSVSPNIGKSAIERQLAERQRAFSESSLVYNPVRSSQRRTKLRDQLQDQISSTDDTSASGIDDGSSKTGEANKVRFSRDYWSSRTDNLSACRLRLTLRHRHSMNDLGNASIETSDVNSFISAEKGTVQPAPRLLTRSPTDLQEAVGMMGMVMAAARTKSACTGTDLRENKQDSGISDCSSGASSEAASPNVSMSASATASHKSTKFASVTCSVPDLSSAASPVMNGEREQSPPVMKTVRSCATLGTPANAPPPVQLRPGDSSLELEKISVHNSPPARRSDEAIPTVTYSKSKVLKSKSSETNLLLKLKQSIFKGKSKTPKAEKRATATQPVGQD